MKTIRAGQELEQFAKSARNKCPRGLLAIECEFFDYIQHKAEEECSMILVCSGKISNTSMIDGYVESIRNAMNLTEKDILNVQKCTAFVSQNFPHAIFGEEGEFTFAIYNLTREEIKSCLAQEELRFTYFSEDAVIQNAKSSDVP